MIREWLIRTGAVVTLAGTLLIGLLGYGTYRPELFAMAPGMPAGQAETETDGGRLFDPQAVHPGDTVAGMQTQLVKPGTNGHNSVSVEFRGTKEISGRFEVVDPETAGYNPGDVVFTADNRSAARLPQPSLLPEAPNRFALQFASNEDKSIFGEPGSTGLGSIVISDYTAVFADILEGVSDKATLAEIRTLHVIPPEPAEMKS